ncbi:MAG: hypothetical protein IKA02_02340 [Clostridia bacterium]|nr:hypothetical protein [Clostridia bacterium]
MKEIIEHEKYGTIEFSEGNIIGNRQITINGEKLTKKSQKEFYLADGRSATVTGSLFTGIKLNIGSDVIQITNAGKWYELTIYILGFVLLIVWSNSIPLLTILPMIGGGIGGLLYAIPAITGFSFSVKQKNPILKTTITLCSVLLGLILCVIVGYLYVLSY